MENKNIAIEFFKDLVTAAVFTFQAAGVGMLASWAGRSVFVMDTAKLISSAGYVAGGTVGLAIIAGSVSKLYYEAFGDDVNENTASKRGLYGMVMGGAVGFVVTHVTSSFLPITASAAFAAIGLIGSVGVFFAVRGMQSNEDVC